MSTSAFSHETWAISVPLLNYGGGWDAAGNNGVCRSYLDQKVLIMLIDSQHWISMRRPNFESDESECFTALNTYDESKPKVVLYEIGS